MKVYITYEKDGYGGIQVDKVFLNESAVRGYVTTPIMVNNAKTFEELAKKQEEHYEVHEVDESL
jgi:hypothetical protein